MDTAALVIAVVALLVAILALLRSRRRRPIPEVVAVADTPQALQAGLATALRHVAVVRYDAFGDVSGRQSFSAALLDDHGDGIVITSLHARTESRTLLKGISGGQADGLSPEERQVVDYAQGTAHP